MIIYLHGFRSAPTSTKARLLHTRLQQQGLGDRLWCEQLAVSPRQAIDQVEAAIAAQDGKPVLIGSSLGGYYATYLAEKHDLRAILINPATYADRTLQPWIGTHTNLYTGETFAFTGRHIEELKALAVLTLRQPSRFWLIVETGDEVLDYREAVSRYAGARQTVIEGGDHGLQSFPRLLDEILSQAGLASQPAGQQPD